MKPGAPLSLDASALVGDPLWLRLGAEARGVLLSMWVAIATRGPLPDDPVATARVALLDERSVLAHWEEVTPFFRHVQGLIKSPHLEAAMEARARRSRAASIAGRARQSQRTLSERSATAKPTLEDAVNRGGSPSSPGIISPLVLSPTPPISPMGLESLESKEKPNPCARVAPPVPEAPPKPKRTPRPKVESSTPPSYRDLFANPEHLEWFEKSVTLRSEHIERMPARLREVSGVAGHRPNKAAAAFLARVRSGYAPRLLAACLYLYLEHGEDVQRGYIQGLDVFFGDPSSPKTKATFQAYLAGASATLAKADARRAAGGAPPPAGPSLPSVSSALLAEAGLPVPPEKPS